MTNTAETPPDWFDDAVALKAKGLSIRDIRDHFEEHLAICVSHTAIWHWTTPAGRRDLNRRNEPDYKAERRAYARNRKRAIEARKEERTT